MKFICLFLCLFFYFVYIDFSIYSTNKSSDDKALKIR